MSDDIFDIATKCPLCKKDVIFYTFEKNHDNYADSNFGIITKEDIAYCSECKYSVVHNDVWSDQIMISKDELQLLRENGWSLVSLFPLKIRKDMLNVSGDYEVLHEVTKIKQLAFSKKS